MSLPNEPAEQSVQKVAWLIWLNFPIGHESQLVEPVNGWYSPVVKYNIQNQRTTIMSVYNNDSERQVDKS